MSRRWTIAVMGLAAAALSAQWMAAAQDAPSITFDAQAVHASGFRPGATIVVFTVIVEPTPTAATVHRWCRAIEDTDRDGAVTFDLHRVLPSQAVWAAIDAQSGE